MFMQKTLNWILIIGFVLSSVMQAYNVSRNNNTDLTKELDKKVNCELYEADKKSQNDKIIKIEKELSNLPEKVVELTATLKEVKAWLKRAGDEADKQEVGINKNTNDITEIKRGMR